MKVLKSMSELRALRGEFRSNPKRVVKEYVSHWEERLDAQGRPWTWKDAAHVIPFNRMKGMQRIYLLFGEVLRLILRDESDQAAAQAVQAMKAIHQFVVDGSWKAAWPLTYQPDPFAADRHGGTELEMEAILAYIRVQDDLARKAASYAGKSNGLSDEEEPAPRATAKAKAKGSNKKEKGAGKGGDAAASSEK
jgi:hypothetical protein